MDSGAVNPLSGASGLICTTGSAFGWGPKGRWFKSSRPDFLDWVSRSRVLGTSLDSLTKLTRAARRLRPGP